MNGTKEHTFRKSIRHAVLRCLEKSDNIFAFLGDFDSQGIEDVDLEHKHSLCEKCQYGAIDCISGLSREGAAAPATHLDVMALPLPRQFDEDGWATWQDCRVLRPTLAQREQRARAFHAVKIVLLENDNLQIDTEYENGVYEAGSVKKGTQLPWSDCDIVLFITDFRHDQDFLRRRLDAVMGSLRASFTDGRIGPITYHSHSRSFEIRGFSDVNPELIKFDILLGSRLTPPDFISWNANVRYLRSFCIQVKIKILSNVS